MLDEVGGNLFRFPENIWEEREVFFPFRCFFDTISSSLIRLASHRQRVRYTLAPSLVRQT